MTDLDRPNLLVTGPPGCGKTTFIRRVLSACTDLVTAGFVTDEVRQGGPDDGRRVAFRLVPIPTGDARIIAHASLVSLQRVGRYGVDVEAINYVADIHLRRAATADLAVIDEIGKMECFSPRFVTGTRALLDGSVPVLGTVSERGADFMAECRGRDDVALVTLTADTRDALVEPVLTWARERVATNGV